MTINKLLLEEFLGYVRAKMPGTKDEGELFSIFKNPTNNDFEIILKETKETLKNDPRFKDYKYEIKDFRYIINTETKDMYATSALALHGHILRFLGVSNSILERTKYIHGSGKYEDNKAKNIVTIGPLPKWAKEKFFK